LSKRLHNLFFFFAVCISTLSYGSTTVTTSVSSPANGSTATTSSVHVAATATSQQRITGWYIYSDNVAVYNTTASAINTNINLPTGTHTLTFRAWNNTGAYGSSNVRVTVAASTSIGVSISPASAALYTGVSQQFTASVSGTTNTAATWWVNGVQGGNSTVGTVTAGGLYTAPAAVPSGGSVTIAAKSAADSSKSASAPISILAQSGKVSISISPTSASVQAGNSQQFTGTVTGTTTTSVVWQVNGVQGGSSSHGTISSSGVFTAAACPSSTAVTVTARSYYDSTAFANAAVSLTAGTSASGQLYVSKSGSDSNDGSACRPWLTIQHALNAATAGKTIHVGPGTYTENSLTWNNSGSSTARIRLVSDQQWGAKIRSSSSYTVFRINGSYVDLAGFDVAGDPNSCLGVANWGSNTRIFGNNVHNIPANVSVCGTNGGAGIVNADYADSNGDIIGNTVHDMGSYPTEDQRVHGIYSSNNGGHIMNNVVFHCAGFGIHLWHAAKNATISNNTVFKNVYGGIYIGNGDSPGGTYASNMTVTNNIVIDNVTWGIIEYGAIGAGNRYLNNIIHGNNSSGRGGNISIKTASGSTQSGTILTDATPLFVNYTGDATGDYHLRSGAYAIGAGTSTGAPTYDIQGGSRSSNGVWDIGAYEYGAVPTLWPWL